MRAVIAVVAVAAAVLAGCSGSDDSDDIAPLQSPTPSATSTETAPVAPASVESKRPDDVQSGQGAKDFSVFVMQNIVYAISTNDTEPLLALSDGASCTTCVSLAKANRERGDVAQVPVGDTAIESIEVEKQSDTRYVVRQTLAFPEIETKDLSSGTVSETDEPSDLPVTAVVVWKDGQWKLQDYGTKEV
jgi:hypothetical protein